MKIAIAILMVLLGAGGLRADEIRLKGGRTLAGRILRVELAGREVAYRLDQGRLVAPEGARALIERPYGLIELAASEIETVTETLDDFDRYDRIAEELDRDLEGRLALARWCRDRKLGHRMRELVREILAEEPDLEEARALVGEVMTEQGWLSESRARALERLRAREEGRQPRSAAIERARLARLEREMRRLAAGIYSQSAKESERSYLALLELARRENIANLAPVAARFYRDAGAQRARLAQATVTVNLQQASLLGLRERSLNLGPGSSVRVQLPETRKIGIGTTVSVPLR